MSIRTQEMEQARAGNHPDYEANAEDGEKDAREETLDPGSGRRCSFWLDYGSHSFAGGKTRVRKKTAAVMCGTPH
jgi:hypothetical protein